MKKIRRAVVSVTDKGGLVEFVKELSAQGVEIISTGGTAKILTDAGVNVIPIASYTGFPEMLDGRVKTLHPKIYGGILGMRGNAEHEKQMDDHGILPIDMVVVNLYAFEKTVAGGADLPTAIENIDIGGPTMIRATAKNFNDTACVTDPGDYSCIIEEMKANQAALSPSTRYELSRKAFALTARYDAAISNYLGSTTCDAPPASPDGAAKFPKTFSVQYKKIQDLRYGENPHQRAAFYATQNPAVGSLSTAKQLQGKELSFNNIMDLNSALELSREFHEPTCIIIKHNNPCGAAMSKNGLMAAYDLALACDSKSAFGGIIGFNKPVTGELAEKMTAMFLEAVIAPGYDEAALAAFKKKKNLRILEIAKPQKTKAGECDCGSSCDCLDIKRVSGGVLIQTADKECASDLKTVTKRGPTEKELEDLIFAWNVAKHVKSNTIVLAKDSATIGVGAGQMSRIDSTRIAVMKAADAGLSVKGSVMASDAFFPFPDNVEMAAKNGVTAIIQPGGSIRDDEVIKAADASNIAMVCTGIRHFRH